MLTRLGQFTVRRRRLVLSLTVLFMIVAGVLGTGAFGVLQDEGFVDPSSESAEAARLLETHFDDAEPNVLLVVTATDGTVDDEAVAVASAQLLDEVRGVEHVTGATSYWELDGPPALRSDDSTRALMPVVVEADGEDEAASIEALREIAERAPPAIEVVVGGADAVGVDIGTTIEGDLVRAETIAIPITLVLLLFVFGGLVAASLPLLVGVVAVLGHVPHPVRGRVDHRRVDLRRQPHHGARPRVGHRLQPVHRVPVPGGAACRTLRGRRRDPLGRNRGAHRADQRVDGRRVARRTLRLPALLPAIVRLCRDRCRAAGDGRIDRDPAGPAGGRRHTDRPPASVPGTRPPTTVGRILVPHDPPGDATSHHREHRGRRRPDPPRPAVLERPVRQPGRSCAPGVGAVPGRQRPAPRGLRGQRRRVVPRRDQRRRCRRR